MSNDVTKYYHGKLPHWRRACSVYFVTLKTRDISLSTEEREVVFDAIIFWHGKSYEVLCFSVMPDHVHLLCVLGENEKTGDLSKVIQSVKKFTARKINERRERTGYVWHKEFYDRIIRGDHELREKINYIYKNPKVAGLVGDREEYPYWWFNEEYFEELA